MSAKQLSQAKEFGTYVQIHGKIHGKTQ